jgi:hypothetical protein
MASKSDNDANDGEKGSPVIRTRARVTVFYLCCVICVIRGGRASS